MPVPQRTAPRQEELEQFYVGKHVSEVPKPSVILDRQKMKRHCQSMLEAAQALGVGFRPHVKTHKTIEGTRLQIGDESREVNMVVSTIAEIEHLMPLLKEYQNNERRVNVLYGIPLPHSQVSRLADVGRQLGHGSISVLVDHSSQLTALNKLFKLTEIPISVFVKIDTGYHRAGVPPSKANRDGLLDLIMQLELKGEVRLHGLYAHSSLSYQNTTPSQAMTALQEEIQGCLDTLKINSHLLPEGKELVISVGASPQVTSIENLTNGHGLESDQTHSLRDSLKAVTTESPSGFKTKLELHAGVYSLLDLQQISTNSRGFLGRYDDEIAVSVLAEVCSLYNDGERAQPEALLGVGVLGLGREPCPSYKGWGVVRQSQSSSSSGSELRLIVDRVSQEHSIVAWEKHSPSETVPPIPLKVGDTVEIYPNHACITGALYGWYLVVDSSDESGGSQITDVWVRASGW